MSHSTLIISFHLASRASFPRLFQVPVTLVPTVQPFCPASLVPWATVVTWTNIASRTNGAGCIYRSVPQIRPPFCNLNLSTKRKGGLYAGCDIFSRDYALPRSRNMSGSVDAGFVLHALLFHHGDLEPDCIGVSTRGERARSARRRRA